jgi:heme-degrading monooxygenase HmoA
MNDSIANTPEPPYYAVIFTSTRTAVNEGYDRMVELAQSMPGFLGVESVRDAQGLGVTVSYWRDEAAIRHWREHAEHRIARETGRKVWYDDFFFTCGQGGTRLS